MYPEIAMLRTEMPGYSSRKKHFNAHACGFHVMKLVSLRNGENCIYVLEKTGLQKGGHFA